MESAIFAAGLVSLGLGAAMSVVGWKALRQNRRREVARTTLLTQLAFPGGMPAQAVTDPPMHAGERFGVDEFRSESPVAFRSESPVAMETLFTEPERSGAASRRTAALGAIVVVFGIVIGSFWRLSGDEPSATAEVAAPPAAEAGATATTVSVPPTVQPAPRLELMSLAHRATPAAFVVTGQVRNAAGDAPLEDVVAVVEVSDSAGRVLATVRAPLKRSGVGAGEFSEFSASAAKATTVARYRVEFQDGARTMIPHFDRRPQAANSRPR